MQKDSVYTDKILDEKARRLFANERKIKRLDGWFLIREISEEYESAHPFIPAALRKARALLRVCERIPLSLDENAVFAGTQRDAFAKSYALINPNFKVSTFNGYCDPAAVFRDIEPNEEFTEERIDKVRRLSERSEYVRRLKIVYEEAENDTREAAYFVEQVTGHLVPDFRPALRRGTHALREEAENAANECADAEKKTVFEAMDIALSCAEVLAKRYAELARRQQKTADGQRREELALLIRTLEKVPARGAENLFEALQSFILLWQVMCMEQAPNPFAFSVGNADRVFEPFRAMENTPRETAAGLFKHLLVFFNVGDRSWAISQNLIVGGKSADGRDLTNLTSYALLDAYYEMNLPQPILSVKVHGGTPDELYREMGKFFFTPGCLTPSVFNDDSLFPVLKSRGADEEDLENYAVAGCQEPLISGKDNGNTTNSWLNLAKILELTLTDGVSLISGAEIGEKSGKSAKEILQNVRALFYENVEKFVSRMVKAANGATEAVAALPVPFLSAFLGGMESGVDARDVRRQGTKYNGSGCLIHGLAVVADSFIAIDEFLKDYPNESERLINALKNNFEGDEPLREYLLSRPKYGNNLDAPDKEAAEIADRISRLVSAQRNLLNNPFRPDWSSPSTHLLYGYWVGATPDGRKAREMLGYGVDPLYGEATNGLGFRLLSTMKLPFERFVGGYASHLGLDPRYFTGKTMEEKGLEFKKKIFGPLFFSADKGKPAPFYVYFNVTTPEMLRKVLEQPQIYAPSGVYIVRIHGTFVNFLDLSPEIQQDIIRRLDLGSTTC